MTKHSDPYRVLFGARSWASPSPWRRCRARSGRSQARGTTCRRHGSAVLTRPLASALYGRRWGAGRAGAQGQDVRASRADVGRGEWRGRTVIRGHAE